MRSSRPPQGSSPPAALPALLRATHLLGLALGSAFGRLRESGVTAARMFERAEESAPNLRMTREAAAEGPGAGRSVRTGCADDHDASGLCAPTPAAIPIASLHIVANSSDYTGFTHETRDVIRGDRVNREGFSGSRGIRVAPQVRLELTTLRLTAECSTIELLRNVKEHDSPARPDLVGEQWIVRNR